MVTSMPFAASTLRHRPACRSSTSELLGRIHAPTLIIHGDDDQIVPIGASALLSSKIVKGAILKVLPSAPHGMCSTHKDQINAELLAFLKR